MDILTKLMLASLVASTVFCGLMVLGAIRSERREQRESLRDRIDFVTTCNKLGIDPASFEMKRSAFEHGEFVGDNLDIVGLESRQRERRKAMDRAYVMGKRTAIGLVKGKPFRPCPYTLPHQVDAWERGYKAWSRIASLKTEGEK